MKFSVIAWCYRTGKGGQSVEKSIALRAMSVAFSIQKADNPEAQ